MAMSRLAAQFAAEIRNHDWSDAPWRADRAGHDRSVDTNRGQKTLTPHEIAGVRLNVAWVTAQVLAFNDPNFDVVEFVEACGIDVGGRAGLIRAGLRYDPKRQQYAIPGTWEYEPVA